MKHEYTDYTKYVQLRAAALMFLEAEKNLDDAMILSDKQHPPIKTLVTRLDAARSVLWDVINDKEINTK